MKQKTVLKKTFCLMAFLGLFGFLGLQAQILTHSYTFEPGTWSGTTVNDQVGTANGTINGSDWEIKNGYFQNHNSNQAATNMGGYISFIGSDLGLSGYTTGLTVEAYVSFNGDQNNPNKYTCLAYFGGAGGANCLLFQTERNASPQGTGSVSVNGSPNVTFPESAANATHHYVVSITPSTASAAGSLVMYIDGTVAGTTALTANSYNTIISGLSSTNAWIGKGAWADPLYTHSIHEFNIYNGAMDAATAQARFKARNTKLATLTVSTGTLFPAFDANINNYGVVIPVGTTSMDVAATTVTTTKAVAGATTYDVSGDYGTITVKADSVGAIPYFINWSKAVSAPVLTHSYNFNDGTANDAVGTDNGTVTGAGTISGGVYTTTAQSTLISGTGQYISLPASTIAIKNYPVVTLEAIGKINSTSTNPYFAYFGNNILAGQFTNNGSTNYVPGNGIDYLYLHTKEIVASYNINITPWSGSSTYSAATNLNDNKVHHVVGIMTMDSLILYQDGVLKGSVLLSNTNRLFNISSNKAYLFQSGYPGDKNSLGSLGEFNIWKGRLAPSTIASRAATYVKDASLSALTVSVGTLTFDPATTTYNVDVPAGTASVIVGATVNKELATVTGAGTITLSPAGTANVVVTSGDGTTTKTYIVNFIPPVPAVSVAQSTLLFNSETNAPQTITVTGANLTDVINITAPAGITVNPTSLPANSNGATVTVSYDGTTTVSGNISISSTGATSQTVGVTGTSYAGCFTKLYTNKTNLITEPYLNSLTTFGGWGATSINTDPAFVYCGLNSGKITGAKAGSIDVNLTGKLRTNASYRVKAMIYSVGGQSQIGIANVGTTLLETRTNTVDAWEIMDFTFNTGSTLGASPLMYFNNYINTVGSTISYIDNLEMYQIPSITVAEPSVAAMATTVGSTDSKTITVSGKGLSSTITLALSGTNADQFSVSATSLPLAADSVVSTVVTITYTPTAASLNHVATLTISSAGATDKVLAVSASAGNTAFSATEVAGWNTSVLDNKLKVTGVDSYEVYSVQGFKVAQVMTNSSSKTVVLKQGIYLVKSDKGVQKVIVR